jgi:dTDP-glucose 4,6-dehydratase
MTLEKGKTPVLITGGYGFMGSHFVRHLYNKYPEYAIINLDVLTYAGNPENLADIELIESAKDMDARRYIHVQGNVCDAQLVERLFNEYSFDLVVHFAAETHVDRSIFNFGDFVRTNIEGTRVLLESAHTHKVRRIVHISTDEVYGNVLEGESVESSPINPSSPYAASKSAGDMLARTYATVYNVPLAIVRSSNNYGTHQYPEKLIPLVTTNLIMGEKIPVHGDGKHIRSWLHVSDFVDAVDRIAHQDNVSGIFNIAGEPYTNIEIIESLARILDVDLTDQLIFVNDRPSADLRYAPNADKIERELGWHRKRSLDEALAETVEWYRTNEPWWRAIKTKREFLDHYEKQSKAQWY